MCSFGLKPRDLAGQEKPIVIQICEFECEMAVELCLWGPTLISEVYVVWPVCLASCLIPQSLTPTPSSRTPLLPQPVSWSERTLLSLRELSFNQEWIITKVKQHGCLEVPNTQVPQKIIPCVCIRVLKQRTGTRRTREDSKRRRREGGRTRCCCCSFLTCITSAQKVPPPRTGSHPRSPPKHRHLQPLS